MLDPRTTERRNPRTASIDLASTIEIVDVINAEDTLVPEAVASQRIEIARAIEIAEKTFRSGGRLFYVGAGTSGRLGVLDASEIPPTFGADPELVQGIIAGGMAALTRAQEGAEDIVDNGAKEIDARNVGPDDFVIGLAASGTTPYVHAAVKRAAEHLAVEVKAGRVISAKNESALRTAHESIGSVLAALGDDQGKASGEPEAKSGASGDDPSRAKPSVPADEPKAGPSVDLLAAQANIYALMGQEGVPS